MQQSDGGGIICLDYASGTMNAYTNGVKYALGAVGSDNASASSLVGWDSGGGQYHRGHISEIIVYNSVLATANREAVELYLSVKYNIPVGSRVQ